MFYTVFAQQSKISSTKSLFICQEIIPNLENEHTKQVVLLPKLLACEFPRSHARGTISLSGQMVASCPSGQILPFLIFFRNCHHTETSSCEACVPSLQSEIQKSFSRCLLVRYCECVKLNKIIVVS